VTVRFAGAVALVTGGASGIGAATARRLAEEAATVIVADRDLEGASVVAKAIGGIAVLVDVTDEASVRRGVAAAEGEVGPIDVLVNNAGFDRPAYFLQTDADDWMRVLAVNLTGTMACTAAVLGGMHDRRTGAIVNMASAAGVMGTAGAAAYSASKGGVIAFTKAIARESARFGVRCNAVAPGPIETPLLQTVNEGLRQGMISATVLGRAGQPEEVAAAIAFLASKDASYITGHTLAVCGGVLMT
jgi:2-hydroxycyclohexanecarboxyl-CoA dehydrogenase